MTDSRPKTQTRPAKHLIVVRESAMYDEMLMEGMIEQTLARAASVPGTEEIRLAGLDPIKNPSRYSGQVIRRGKTKAVLFERDGTHFLYSEGSAAANDDEGNNAFVGILTEVIKDLRPEELWVSTFSRLTRAPEFAGDLFRAGLDYVKVVHAETDINLTDPSGVMMWQILAMLAGAERDSIVRRLVTGTVFAWKKGRWLTPAAIPPGYRLDPEGHLELVAEEVPKVRAMLELLANPNLNAKEICDRLGALGLTRAQIQRHHGEEATFADVSNPNSAVASLRGWLPVYETGRYEYRQAVPLRHVTNVGGVPVLRDKPDDVHGYLSLPIDVPAPDDGWASPEVFAQAKELMEESRLRDGKAHRKVKPLVNHFRFTDADGRFEYALLSTHNRYHLYQRPSGNPEQAWYVYGGIAAEKIATIRPGDLHRSIAEGIAQAIRDGVPATRLNGETFWIESSPHSLPKLISSNRTTDFLRRQLAEHQTRAARARKHALDFDDPDTARALLNDASYHQRKAEEVRRELAELEHQTETSSLPERWESNAAAVAQALANLATIDGAADGSIRAAMDEIITNSRMTVDAKQVAWTLHVRLPLDTGVALLGPIRGTVPNLHRPPSLAEQLRRAGLSRKAARLLAQHPDRDLVRTLLDEAARANEPFLSYMWEVYTADLTWWRSRTWRAPDQGRQLLIDAVQSLGGSATPNQLRQQDIDRNHIHRFSKQGPEVMATPAVRRVGDWKKGPANQPRKVALVQCPHCCGYATHVMRVPEIPCGLLCPDCRRMPTQSSPVFPNQYFELEVSGHRKAA